jgi:hypothetical protein
MPRKGLSTGLALQPGHLLRMSLSRASLSEERLAKNPLNTYVIGCLSPGKLMVRRQKPASAPVPHHSCSVAGPPAVHYQCSV